MVEPSLGGYTPGEPFGLEQGALVHEIMRLLTGSVNVLNQSTGKVLCLTTNELRLPGPRTAKPERIVAILFEEQVNLHDYASFILSISRRNQHFFLQLRRELMLCLLCKKTRRFTESFLYLYRILEFVSVALPFLYASTQRSFVDSHSFLKSLVGDEKNGELKVLEKALPTLVSQTDLSQLSFDFNIAGSQIEFVAALKHQLRRAVAPAVPGIEFETEGDILFRVPFLSMSNLLVSLRNRMFHYKAGQKNIDLAQLGGAERILEICINELIYWFSLTFTEIVRTLANQSFRSNAGSQSESLDTA